MNVLLGILAAAFAVEVPAIDAAVELPDGWSQIEVVEGLVENAAVQLVHGPSGAGAVIRGWPLSAEDLPPRAQRIADLDAALSADHLAVAFAANQEDGSAERTVYLGLSDVAGARVGRWVFTTPAEGDEPERIWWHAYWRTDGHIAQLIGWAPLERLPRVIGSFRALETRLGTVSGYTPPAALLHQEGGRCEGNAGVDRMRAIAESGAIEAARSRITAKADTSEGRVAELEAVYQLVKRVDDCIADHARKVGACAVYERASETDRSARLQAAITTCVGTH